VSKILDIAQKEIGTKEVPADTNKSIYGEWFGFDGVAWCGMFVSWVYYHAGYPLGKIGFSKGFAGCGTAMKHFKDSGEVITDLKNVKPGDIFIVDWNGDNRVDHTGIVKTVDTLLTTGFFKTIEGNTAVGNDSNGGEVMERSRKLGGKAVWYFIHPKVLDINKGL
jgi:hypothetical protein